MTKPLADMNFDQLRAELISSKDQIANAIYARGYHEARAMKIEAEMDRRASADWMTPDLSVVEDGIPPEADNHRTGGETVLPPGFKLVKARGVLNDEGAWAAQDLERAFDWPDVPFWTSEYHGLRRGEPLTDQARAILQKWIDIAEAQQATTEPEAAGKGWDIAKSTEATTPAEDPETLTTDAPDAPDAQSGDETTDIAARIEAALAGDGDEAGAALEPHRWPFGVRQEADA